MTAAAAPGVNERRYLGFLISDVARLMRAAFDRRVRGLGLTRAQWQVLGILFHRPGVSQAELAERLEVEPATAGRLIDRLEAKGWVHRRPDPADRRVKRLHLSEGAAEVQDRMGRIAGEFLEDALASLNAAEREALAGMMERMKLTLLDMAPEFPAEAEHVAALPVVAA